MDRDDIIRDRAESNFSDFMDNGPGLRLGKLTWVLARGEGNRVLHGGLGSFGHGTMWGEATDHDKADMTMHDAPYAPERRDDFGRTGFSEAENQHLMDIDDQAQKVAQEAYTAIFKHARERFTESMVGPITFTTTVTWSRDSEIVDD